MNKWKLTRLEIDSFKVFENFKESFDCDFIVFDGPNGFGKTSIYDAMQLLFCGSIPRISALAKAIKIQKSKQYSRNLYWNNRSDREIIIKAEFSNGKELKVLMRKASLEDLKKKKNNKPDQFSIFKLYLLESFDNLDSAKIIKDEELFLNSIFGDYFKDNYSILNYMSQDNNPIIVPDHSNGEKSRFDQISHLINLDEIEVKLKKLNEIKRGSSSRIKVLNEELIVLGEQVSYLKTKLKESLVEVGYKKLTPANVSPQWDKSEPIISPLIEDYEYLKSQTKLLENAVIQIDEIILRQKNNSIDEFIAKADFSIAVRIGNQFDKYDILKSSNKKISKYEAQCKTLSVNETEISRDNIDKLTELDASYLHKLKQIIETRDDLLKQINGSVRKLTELNQLRLAIIGKLNELENKESNCPVCGFDYKENTLLLEAIDAKSSQIELVIESHDNSLKKCLEELKSTKTESYQAISQQITALKVGFDNKLLIDLEKNVSKKQNLESICNRLAANSIELEKEYSSDFNIQQDRLQKAKDQVLNLKTVESDILLEGTIGFYNSIFSSILELKQIELNDVKQKAAYIDYCYNKKVNTELANKEKTVIEKNKSIDRLSNLDSKLSSLLETTNEVKNTYSSQTLGQIESLFHIYSGRLIQNYQRGLGLFIDTEEDKVDKKSKALSFFTADGTEYDAILSMSSGQIAALTLAFFLSLNRKYSNTAFILIDDPTQCMDEINIASLSDLLRVELKDRQVIISTHEQEVSDYLRYRYLRGGLNAKSIHLQNMNVDSIVQN